MKHDQVPQGRLKGVQDYVAAYFQLSLRDWSPFQIQPRTSVLFDYDLTTAPKLLTVKHDGKMVDVVAAAGKNGFLYVFDRVTGKPIWPIVERPVPQSDMHGEHSWPTQPFPTAPPPFATRTFTPDDVDPYIADPPERARIKEQLQNARNAGIVTPAGTKDTVEMPGNNGGGNWGSGAVDPPTGTLYIASKNAPSMIRLEPNRPKREMTGTPETEGRILYIQNCQSCHTAELTGPASSIWAPVESGQPSKPRRTHQKPRDSTYLPYLSRRISNVAVPWSLIDRLIVHC